MVVALMVAVVSSSVRVYDSSVEVDRDSSFVSTSIITLVELL